MPGGLELACLWVETPILADLAAHRRGRAPGLGGLALRPVRALDEVPRLRLVALPVCP